MTVGADETRADPVGVDETVPLDLELGTDSIGVEGESEGSESPEVAGGFFGAGEIMQADEGDVRPSRGALDHPASQFLGREFLLWVWWRSEVDFATVELAEFGTVDFWIDDHIQFRTSGDDPQISDIRGGAPATTLEARTALLSGKTVESFKMALRVREREYSFSLRADSLEIASLKVPSDLQEGADEKIYERMFLLEEVTGILDALFFRFLELRLTETWNREQVPAIRDWIAGQRSLASDLGSDGESS